MSMRTNDQRRPSRRLEVAWTISIAVLVCLTSGSISLARAEPPQDVSLPQAITSADAVLHGTVSRIDYRIAESDTQKPGLPHTFVTYRIMEVLAGRVDTSSVTLRFIGGPDGRGGFVSVSHVPSFNVGDEDILMVRGNGQSACPLVDCEEGRIRVFQDGTYSARGIPMARIDSGSATFAGRVEPVLLRRKMPTPAFDDLLQNPRVAAIVAKMTETTSLDELRRRYEREAPEFTEYTMASSRKGEGDYGWGSVTAGADRASTDFQRPVLAAELLASIRDAVVQHDTGAMKPPIESLDPDEHFTAPGISILK